VISERDLLAPESMLIESASAIRRLERLGDISRQVADLAHRDLLRLRVHLFAYEPLAPRVWNLRNNYTPYDAAYVALAEATGSRLATLDKRMAAATGAKCSFLIPD
jgi:predicted nucleic acid-binding protein